MYIEKLDYMFNNIVKSTNLVNGSLEIECNISTETGRKLSEQLTRLKDLRKKLNTEEELKNLIISITTSLDNLNEKEDYENYDYLNNMLVLESILEKEINEYSKN